MSGEPLFSTVAETESDAISLGVMGILHMETASGRLSGT
jgi:hypothetical protein